MRFSLLTVVLLGILCFAEAQSQDPRDYLPVKIAEDPPEKLPEGHDPTDPLLNIKPDKVHLHLCRLLFIFFEISKIEKPQRNDNAKCDEITNVGECISQGGACAWAQQSSLCIYIPKLEKHQEQVEYQYFAPREPEL